MTSPTACPYTFAIVARHLDGDVAAATAVTGAPSWEPGDFLAEHLQQCAQCRRELQRSRRLDAALAEASGRATSDLEADPTRLRQLLGRAVARADATPTATIGATPARAQPRSLQLQLLGALLLLALGFALCLWLLPRGDDRTKPAQVPASAPSAFGTAAPDLLLAGPAAPPLAAPSPALLSSGANTAIPLGTNVPPTPIATSTFAVPRTRADAQALADVLADRALADRLQLTASLQFASCGGHSQPAVARAAAAALRVRSSQLLLDAPAPVAFDAWCRAAAGLDAGPDLDQVLADARRRPAVAAWLGQRLLALGQGRARGLGDLAAMTVAARMGGRELDAALRQLVRRADVQQELAAALRLPGARDGRTALLLDVWGDLVARGRGADEELARTLFPGQPAGCVRELQQELQQGRQLPRRIRCLLALGVVGGPQVRDTLVAALRGPVQPEAHAAAYALAQLPPAQLRDLLPEAARADRWLLRAALCRAGLPEALEWLRNLELTPAERALLADGDCTLAQFPVLAALLHDRGPSTF